ncbi:unnamed protein product [Absidia cylindrospora]
MVRSPPNMGSLGASGSVMGLTTFFACAFPKATFLVFFVIPMPAIAVVGLFAAYDVYKATTLNTGIVDSAAHIGGVSYGAAYWFLRVKPLLRAAKKVPVLDPKVYINFELVGNPVLVILIYLSRLIQVENISKLFGELKVGNSMAVHGSKDNLNYTLNLVEL